MSRTINLFTFVSLIVFVILLGFPTTFAVEPSILSEMTSNEDVKSAEDAELTESEKLALENGKGQNDGTGVSAQPVPAPIPVAALPPTAVLVAAAPKAPTEREKEVIEEQVNVVAQFTNPNELINYFQEKVWSRDYDKAIACVDFTSSTISVKTKRNIVYKLNIIFSRLEEKDVSNYPKDKTNCLQAFSSPKGMIDIYFVKGEHQNWQFSFQNIRTLDRNFDLLRKEPPVRLSWLMNNLPSWSYSTIGGIPLYRLYFLIGGLLLGFLTKILIQNLLFHITLRFLKTALEKWEKEEVSRKLWSPIGTVALLSCAYVGLALMMPNPDLQEYIFYTYAVLCIIYTTKMLFRMVNLLNIWLRHQMRRRDSHIDDIFIPLFSRTMKILAFCFGLIATAYAFGWPMFGIISGMGIGGVAIAFAAKETIGNFFGSLTVLFDRPFAIGDWIITDSIEGTVESVGMRSTRVRTFYNSVVTIPNNNLNTATIDNMGARVYRRYKTFLSVEYGCEPARIEAFCEGVRELIRRHPHTRKDAFHVYLHEFKSASLDILLVVFFDCPDTPTEYRERSSLMLDVLRLAKLLDVRFAFPTQTLYTIPSAEVPRSPMSNDPLTLGRSAAIEVYPIEE